MITCSQNFYTLYRNDLIAAAALNPNSAPTKSFEYSIQPNPVNNTLTIVIDVYTQVDGHGNIRDRFGNLVYSNNFGTLAPGQHIFNVDVSTYANDIYFITLDDGTDYLSETFIVQH